MATGDREVRVRPGVVIPAADLAIRFSRSGGPGGQNVNKVETRVEVRFDLAATALLRPEERALADDGRQQQSIAVAGLSVAAVAAAVAGAVAIIAATHDPQR